MNLSPLPVLRFYSNIGLPLVGGKLFTYAAGTTTKIATYTNSSGGTPNTNPIILNFRGEANVWLDPSLTYKFVLSPANDTDPPTNPIWSVDNIAGPLTASDLTQQFLGQIIYPRTAAESAVSVTPVSYIYPPGDLRRYGASVNGDITTALTSAAAQANQTGGAPIYVPSALGTGCTVTAGVSITAPILIHGDDYSQSIITTASDITIFSFTLAASRSVITDLQLVGKGAGATLPGILYTNSNNNYLRNVRVRSFGVGIRFAAGANSCYLNTLNKCIVENNITINIDGQINTNALHLISTQFGGSSQTGLKLVDSNNLMIAGGDCEGVSVCGIDLDATSTLRAGHLIMGFHFEGNTSSVGDIRIGNTASVDGVTIVGSLFKPGTGNIAAINAVNCDGLAVLGYTQIGAYTSVPFLQKTNLTNEILIAAGPTADNLAAYQANVFKPNYADAAALTWLAATAYQANYQDSANFLQYMIKSGSMTAGKLYFGGFDVARITNAGAPGAGAKAYARAMMASNGFGGTLKVGAAFLDGDFDMQNGAASFGQSATAPAIGAGGTITTANTTVARVSPAGAVAGVIMQAGTVSGQKIIVINEAVAANTVTFAVAGTSNVADGVASVIAGLKSASFYWDTGTNLWYHSV